ncbi:hypothetical protein [Tomitella gaofuii]|uniref:hypothetical protein n=1 Tax=Tomitella gaofuii TaxID=2760083 RepID=UPI0015F80C96|nr:hypothetical protein [Tomitella gaofuii]
MGTNRPVIPADGLTVHHEQEEAARRVVAGNSSSAAEAAEFMAMLGITPDKAEVHSRPTSPLSKNQAAALRGRTKAKTVRLNEPCAGGCGQLLRPYKMRAAEAPGTVGATGRGMCSGCYRKARADEAQEAAP